MTTLEPDFENGLQLFIYVLTYFLLMRLGDAAHHSGNGPRPE